MNDYDSDLQDDFEVNFTDFDDFSDIDMFTDISNDNINTNTNCCRTTREYRLATAAAESLRALEHEPLRSLAHERTKA